MARGEVQWEETVIRCPKCGHTFKAENQAKGGKARWRGISTSQRRKAAGAAAKARWARRVVPENDQGEGRPRD